MSKYNYEDFKNDPRTGRTRYVLALFKCIDNKTITPDEIFAEIDKAYLVDKPRGEGYIKRVKLKAIKLLQAFGLG